MTTNQSPKTREVLEAENIKLQKALEEVVALTGMRRYAITTEPVFLFCHKVSGKHIDAAPYLAEWLAAQE
jgi:hypothetical protein